MIVTHQPFHYVVRRGRIVGIRLFEPPHRKFTWVNILQKIWPKIGLFHSNLKQPAAWFAVDKGKAQGPFPEYTDLVHFLNYRSNRARR